MSSPESTRPTSTRVAIARLAEGVIAADPGVGPTSDGGRWSTHDGDREIPGIVVTAAGSGRVEVDLHLIAYMPPRPLAEQATDLRSTLFAEARRSGMGESLGEIDVTIHDLLAPEEIPAVGLAGTDGGEA